MDRIKSFTNDLVKGPPFSKWFLIVIVILAISAFIMYQAGRNKFVTPNNVRTIATNLNSSADEVVSSSANRQGLSDYIATDLSGLAETDILFGNFQFSTVRVAGCFLPEKVGGESVFSVDALNFACQGGARAFVFDIWPSIEPNEAFRPVLQIVEEGSNWRRVSMNSMDFDTAVKTIVDKVYSPSTPSFKDLCVFYLRFQNHESLPPQTYASVAASLNRHALKYLLDPSFSNVRRVGDLINTSIRELQQKIVIITNIPKTALHPNLLPYVNICASDDSNTKIEYTLSDLDNLDTTDVQRHMKSTITFLILPATDERVITNEWSWATAFAAGIHCVPMNIFNRVHSGDYYNTLFPKYSYKLKPSAKRVNAIVAGS